jgi:hypothetical protein
VLRTAHHLDSAGVQQRLAAHGTRARATGTRAGTAHHQITTGHSAEWQPTYGTEH